VSATAADRRDIDRLAARAGLVVGPERRGPADDRVGQDRAEIAAAEGMLGLPVHQQDLALGDGAAALQTGSVRPRRSRSSAVPIAMPSTAMVRSVRQTVCRGRAKDALQQWHVFGQMTAIGKEARERLRRPDDDQLGGVEHAGRAHGIEPDGDAGAGVPDPRRRRVKESRKSEG
jgi:hypothetical protein